MACFRQTIMSRLTEERVDFSAAQAGIASGNNRPGPDAVLHADTSPGGLTVGEGNSKRGQLESCVSVHGARVTTDATD